MHEKQRKNTGNEGNNNNNVTNHAKWLKCHI